MPEMIDFHQAAQPDVIDSTSDEAKYKPTQEEKKAIKLVNRLFSTAKKHREKYDKNWLHFYKMFRGDQWKEKRPSYRHSAVFNKIFRVIQSQIPILTDAKPSIDYLPENPEDRPLADILSQIAKADWDRRNWLQKIAEILFDGAIYGTSYGCIGWDQELSYGIGEITFKSEDPFFIFPDPESKGMNDPSQRYVIIAEPTDLGVIKKEYPKLGKFVRPDLVDLMRGSKTSLGEKRYRSPVDAVDMVETGQSVSDAQENNKCLKLTLYLKDGAVIKESKMVDDKDTGEKKEIKIDKKKYPRGRKIVIASNVLLEDGHNDAEDGRFPLARYTNYILPREFYGISEVENLEGPQLLYNKIYSFVLDVLTLMGNPIYIVDSNSGVNTANLFNRPGLVIEKNPQSEVRRESGVQLQPYVMNLLGMVKDEIDDISGNNDVSRGQSPGGVTAAKAIEALQESSLTRMRQKAKNLDAFLQEIGQLYASRVFQHYSIPRIVRLTNENDPENMKFFKMHIEPEVDAEGNPTGDKVAKIRETLTGDDGRALTNEQGVPQLSDETKTFKIPGRFDIKASTGTSLGFVKAAKEARALELFQLGIIDKQDVLDKLDWPDKDKVQERMQLQEQQVQQAQAQQGEQQAQAQAQAAQSQADSQAQSDQTKAQTAISLEQIRGEIKLAIEAAKSQKAG